MFAIASSCSRMMMNRHIVEHLLGCHVVRMTGVGLTVVGTAVEARLRWSIPADVVTTQPR